MNEKVVLIKARPQPVTADQTKVNEGLKQLYEKHRQRLGMIKSASDIRAWGQELGVEDPNWFFGEVLMMVHPSFVPIGPELYNQIATLASEFESRESWFGLHLKLGPSESKS